MPDIQGLIGTTASAMAVLAGILALVDRWASRRQPPALVTLTSPAGLILPTRLSRPAKPRRSPPLLRAVRGVSTGMAWLVGFVGGSNLFTLAVYLLIPGFPEVARAAADTDVASGTVVRKRPKAGRSVPNDPHPLPFSLCAGRREPCRAQSRHTRSPRPAHRAGYPLGVGRVPLGWR